jgi:hypothetical protein
LARTDSSNPPRLRLGPEHLKAYCALATESGGWGALLREFVQSRESEYLASVGGVTRLTSLPVPVF